jgi:hypothetical protein
LDQGCRHCRRPQDADGEHVLTWWQAEDNARKLARGTDAGAGRPVTVKEAVDTCEKDLIARRGSLRNVGRIRKHPTPRLASRPVALLTSDGRACSVARQPTGCGNEVVDRSAAVQGCERRAQPCRKAQS